MSFRVIQDAYDHAQNQLIDLMDSTIALIRPKNVRWLNLLAANTDENARSLIAGDSYVIMSHLIKKQELSTRTQVSVRMVYPKFDPNLHFGKITKDDLGRIVSFVPVPHDASLHKDIVHARDIWETCIRHRELVDGHVRRFEIFADGLWELTGTALVKKITDFTGRTNYAIDRAVAGDITTELFPTEVIEDVEDESKEASEETPEDAPEETGEETPEE